MPEESKTGPACSNCQQGVFDIPDAACANVFIYSSIIWGIIFFVGGIYGGWNDIVHPENFLVFASVIVTIVAATLGFGGESVVYSQ